MARLEAVAASAEGTALVLEVKAAAAVEEVALEVDMSLVAAMSTVWQTR